MAEQYSGQKQDLEALERLRLEAQELGPDPHSDSTPVEKLEDVAARRAGLKVIQGGLSESSKAAEDTDNDSSEQTP